MKCSWRRFSGCCGIAISALLVAVVMMGFVFGNTLLNAYGKSRLERVFAEANPGYSLRLGALGYSPFANRLSAQSLTVTATNLTFTAGPTAVAGVRWARLLWGTLTLADGLAQASLDTTNLSWELPASQYEIRCARLRATVPAAEFQIEGAELRPRSGVEAFFAASASRATRFRVVVPDCRLTGVAYPELLQGSSYRATAIHFSGPSFEALVNRDKPSTPLVKKPLMVHEALSTIRPSLQIGMVTITNGHLTYGERMAVGAEPGILTFAEVNLSAQDITNQRESPADIQIQAQSRFMNAGLLRVRLKIPVNPPDFSLHYSGSLGAMELTRLDAFLAFTEYIQIKSGHVQEVTFDVRVTAGRAHGWVRAEYQDLAFALLNPETGSASGVGRRMTAFLANTFKVRNASAPGASRALREGVVDYWRSPDEQFLEFLWAALHGGVIEVISF